MNFIKDLRIRLIQATEGYQLFEVSWKEGTSIDSVNPNSVEYIKSLNRKIYRFMFWSIDIKDWFQIDSELNESLDDFLNRLNQIMIDMVNQMTEERNKYRNKCDQLENLKSKSC